MDNTERIIDDLVDNYYTASWNSSLVISGCVLCPKTKTYEEYQIDARNVDIFQYTSNGNTLFKDWILRFDPQVYKVNNEEVDQFGSESDGLKVVRTITKMLFDDGQGTFVSNGAKTKKFRFTERSLCCSRHKLYQGRNTDTNETDEILSCRRTIQLRSVPGPATNAKMKKCTSTSLPITVDEKCSCHISIRADHNSYFISCGIGNSSHRGHPRVDPSYIVTRKRHLPKECIETIKEYTFCKATLGSAILASNVRHKVNLSRRQCASIMNLEHLKFAFDEVLDSDSSSWTAPEQMYEMFKKKKILFGMLYHSKAAIDSELPGYEARRKQRKKDAKAKETSTVTNSNENIPPPINGCNVNDIATMDSTMEDEDAGVCIFETFFPESTDCVPTIIHDSDPVDYAFAANVYAGKPTSIKEYDKIRTIIKNTLYFLAKKKGCQSKVNQYGHKQQ